MKSIYKNLKKIFLLVAMIGSSFNNVNAYRSWGAILDDCSAFFYEQCQKFNSIEEAQNCIDRINKLLKDIKEFCISPAVAGAPYANARDRLRDQEEPLKLRRREALLYLHPEDRETFKLLKAQARAGYLDLWAYLTGGELENNLNLNEQQINELISILIERTEMINQQELQISEEYFQILKDQARVGNLELRPYLPDGKLKGSLNERQVSELLTILSERRPDPIIRKALQQRLSEQFEMGNLRIGDVKKWVERGFLDDSEIQFWLEVLEGRDRQDT